MKSDSSAYNTYPFFTFILIFILMHLCIFALVSIVTRLRTNGRCSLLVTFIQKITNKIFIIMTYGYYIRFILEMNQYLLVCSISEIHNFNTTQSLRLASLIIAILILSGCLMLIAIIFLLSLSSYESIDNERNYIGELFSGVKMQRKTKLYVCVLLIRRLVFIVLLINLTMISSPFLIAILTLLQLFYLVYLAVTRPFKETKCNIIEIVNEMYYILLLSSLIYLNSKQKWKSGLITIYSTIITSSSVAVLFIILIDVVKLGIIKLCQCVKGKNQSTQSSSSRIHPENTSNIKINKIKPETNNTTIQDNDLSRNTKCSHL